MTDPIKNISVSIRQRLANLAKERGIEFQRVLVLYALERLMYRLSISPFADRFILKGASLFSLWLDEPHRRTRDIDLLGKDDLRPGEFVSLFQSLCSISVNEDAIRFAPETVKTRQIREANEFGGVRITMTAFLDNAQIAVQVDVGFGDATVPEPQEVDFPTLLKGFAAPRLLAYQKETTIAEKLHAIVILERSNSRMKDFFDIYVLAQEFSFNQASLTSAICYAFDKRKTTIPIETPDGLTKDFSGDSGKVMQWKAFLIQDVTPPRNTLALPAVVDVIAAFLIPVLEAARSGSEYVATWTPGGPWESYMG